LLFYAVLLVAGGTDVLATTFGFSVNQAFWFFRVLLVLLPVAGAWFAHRLCRELQARDLFVEPSGDQPDGDEPEGGDAPETLTPGAVRARTR
jgi:ubiquinol-cytochrome c reductase cytochrome b subunit